MNSAIAKLCVSLILVATSSMAQAAVVTLPENELPSETVLPKLDNSTVVLNRAIQKNSRFSLGVSYGNLLDEMFYNSQMMSLDMRYNTSEMGAWGLRYDSWAGGATTYTDAFATSTVTNGPWHFDRAPSRQSGLFLVRYFDLYYGKVSWGKEVITPMHFSWLAMAGAQNYEAAWLPALQGGGQLKVYFTKHASFDIGYLFSVYQKIDPTSASVAKTNKPNESAFSKKISFGQIFQFGLSYLF